jgi:hypothetical protein
VDRRRFGAGSFSRAHFRTAASPEARQIPRLCEPPGDAEAYVALLRRFAILAADVEPVSRLSPDPGDEYLLSLAAAHGVDYLISGDPHLTGIKRSLIPILTPRAMVDRLAAGA